MQKSKKVTIFLIIAVTIFFLFCQSVLTKFGILYSYILKPICFVGIAAIINVLISSQIVIRKSRNDIVQYVLITVFSYILIYIVSGIVPGYGTNPYDTSIKGILINIVTNVPVLIALEFMRYKLVNNVLKNDRDLIFCLVVVAFSIWDLNLVKLLSGPISFYKAFTIIFYNLIPTLIENILFTYIAQNGDYVPNMIYRVVFNLFLWSSPILPQLPWVFEAILSSVLPLFLLLYVRYFVNMRNKNYVYTNKYDENPKGLIPFSMLLVVLIWFTLGAFPIKPVGIASASMKPSINVGDMVILSKVKPETLKEGDIIGYKSGNTTIVHRIKTIINNNGKYTFITKGDNNKTEDGEDIKESQLVGKVIFRVKYVAYPTVWMNALYNSEKTLNAEKGN